jgi:RND family efflux transporter MFP subunit
MLALTGCKGSGGKEGPGQGPGGPGAPGAAKPMPVDVMELRPGPVREAGEYLGTLISRSSITLYPQVSGYIQRITARPGQRVEAGEVLLEVDPRRERASVRSAEAQRNSALAQRQYAQRTRQRAEQLVREGIMSRQEYEQAMAQAAAAEASAHSAEAQLQAQQVELGYYRVKAPFAGVVGDIPVKRGDYVSPQTPLTNVDQSQALEVSVAVPPESASRIQPGTTQVEILDDEGQPVVSTPVFFVAPTPDPRTQLVEVKAAFENAVGLRAGQVVRTRVVYETRESLRLPTFAVTQQSSQFFAMVAAPGDSGTPVARRQPVKVGQIEGNYYELLSGLDAGTQVVVGSLQAVRDGQPIQPRPVQHLPGEGPGVGGAADAGLAPGPDGGR